VEVVGVEVVLVAGLEILLEPFAFDLCGGGDPPLSPAGSRCRATGFLIRIWGRKQPA